MKPCPFCGIQIQESLSRCHACRDKLIDDIKIALKADPFFQASQSDDWYTAMAWTVYYEALGMECPAGSMSRSVRYAMPSEFALAYNGILTIKTIRERLPPGVSPICVADDVDEDDSDEVDPDDQGEPDDDIASGKTCPFCGAEIQFGAEGECRACGNYVGVMQKPCSRCGKGLGGLVTWCPTCRYELFSPKNHEHRVLHLLCPSCRSPVVELDRTESEKNKQADRKEREKQSFKNGMLWLVGGMLLVIIAVGAVFPPGAIVVLILGTLYVRAVSREG